MQGERWLILLIIHDTSQVCGTESLFIYIYGVWSVLRLVWADRKEMLLIFITPDSLVVPLSPPGRSYSPSHFMTLTGCGGGGERGREKGETQDEKVAIIWLNCPTSMVYYPEHRLGSLTLSLTDHIVKPVSLSHITRPALGLDILSL